MDRRKAILDAHDDQEREEIRAVLSELSEDHPAWEAHRDGADAITLTHLVERKEHIYKLTQAWLHGYGRMLRRSSNFRPSLALREELPGNPRDDSDSNNG